MTHPLYRAAMGITLALAVSTGLSVGLASCSEDTTLEQRVDTTSQPNLGLSNDQIQGYATQAKRYWSDWGASKRKLLGRTYEDKFNVAHLHGSLGDLGLWILRDAGYPITDRETIKGRPEWDDASGQIKGVRYNVRRWGELGKKFYFDVRRMTISPITDF